MPAGRDIQDRAFRFACQIVATAEGLIRSGGAVAHLARQLLDAGTSIGANLEEATGAQSKRDFIAKAAIAYKEARETYFWLRLITATTKPLPADMPGLCAECNELVAILNAILRRARSSPTRGE
jgi:four helix bundle protein